MEKENKMGVKPVIPLVIEMAIPLMMSLLIQSLYNIVDGIFVSRISENALTATSLAYPVQMLMISVAVGTSVGVNAFLSKSVGEGNREKSSQIATTGLFLAIITAVCFMVLGAAGSGWFIGLFTENEEIAANGSIYLRICTVFCLGSILQIMYQRFFQAVGDTILSMITLIIGAVVNMILDPIMIFGLLGCPAMGVTGAAIATVVGQWLGGASGIVLHQIYNKEVRLKIEGFRFKKEIVKEIYRVGVPTIIMQTMNSVMVSVVNIILIPFSTTAVAFFGAYYKLQNFLFMPTNGLGQAAIPVIGFNRGAKKPERIGLAIKTVVVASVSIGIIATIIFMAFPGQLLSLFAAGDDMLAIGIPALRIISITFVFACLTIVLGYIGTGFGNGSINMIGGALRQFIIYIPCMYILAKVSGIGFVWYASWPAEGIAFVYSIIAVKKCWKYNQANSVEAAVTAKAEPAK